MNLPSISVITVVFNDLVHIENTIKSVLGQDYPNIEYIIIDGNSNDGTVDIIKKYNSKISKWISEPDKGIYDAMNKGLLMATGDYVLFMNSGDVFYDSSVLSDVFRAENYSYDIYYGDAAIINESGNILGLRRHRPPEHLTWKSFVNGMLVSHQAFIPKRKLAPLYDLKYKVAADIDWCIRIMKNAESAKNTKRIIVKFLQGGMSARRKKLALKERFEIMKKYYGLFPTLKTYFVNSFKTIFYFLKHGRDM